MNSVMKAGYAAVLANTMKCFYAFKNVAILRDWSLLAKECEKNA